MLADFLHSTINVSSCPVPYPPLIKKETRVPKGNTDFIDDVVLIICGILLYRQALTRSDLLHIGRSGTLLSH